MRYVLTAHPATDALTVLPLIRFLEISLAAAALWQIIGTVLPTYENDGTGTVDVNMAPFKGYTAFTALIRDMDLESAGKLRAGVCARPTMMN